MQYINGFKMYMCNQSIYMDIKVIKKLQYDRPLVTMIAELITVPYDKNRSRIFYLMRLMAHILNFPCATRMSTLLTLLLNQEAMKHML